MFIQKILLFCVIVFSIPAFAEDKITNPAEPPYHINEKANKFTPSGLTPDQVKHIYGFDQYPYQGEGQTIAIIDAFDHPNIESDLEVFNSTFGLPACTTANGCFKKIYARDTAPPVNAKWAMEIAIDVEWAHAIAPKAKILLIEAANNSYSELAQATRVAVKNNANTVSMSWGALEFADEAKYDRTFNVRHVTFVASAGDRAQVALYPAASPYVLSVGGTSLTLDSNGNYLSETTWSKTNGGLSLFERQLNNQRRFPIPNNITDSRGVPDVAYHADPDLGYSVYNSLGYKDTTGWFVAGGTSVATPQWAALVAIADEVVGEGLTINTVLYRIGKSAAYNSNFNDIVSGRSGDCGYFCRARTGYDYVTGLGTPKMPTLVKTVYQYYLARHPR